MAGAIIKASDEARDLSGTSLNIPLRPRLTGVDPSGGLGLKPLNRLRTGGTYVKCGYS
jgi:hypothetical protein